MEKLNNFKLLRGLLFMSIVLILSACNEIIEYPSPPKMRGSVNLVSELEKTENNNAGIHPKVSKLYSFLMLLQKNQINIEGQDILTAIDHFDPKFSKTNDDVYKGLGKIRSVFNNTGKIYITIVDDEELDVDKMRIKSGSRIVNSSASTGGKMKFDVEEGMTVGWGFIRFDVNFIELDAKTGNLTFNYGSNESETVNIQDIIT